MRHGPLLERFFDAGAQLRFVERLAAAVALHHHGHDELGGLERGEPLTARETLPAAANLAPFSREAGVGHLSLYMAAKGAVHAAGATLTPYAPYTGKRRQSSITCGRTFSMAAS